MCQLFIGADSTLWESHTRSMRIDGMSTSVRLEAFFWDTLEEIAYRDDMTVTSLITKLYFESIDEGHDLGNFTSFLRVCCSRYHSLLAIGAVPSSLSNPIGSLHAKAILDKEKQLREQKQLMILNGSNAMTH